MVPQRRSSGPGTLGNIALRCERNHGGRWVQVEPVQWANLEHPDRIRSESRLARGAEESMKSHRLVAQLVLASSLALGIQAQVVAQTIPSQAPPASPTASPTAPSNSAALDLSDPKVRERSRPPVSTRTSCRSSCRAGRSACRCPARAWSLQVWCRRRATILP
jgi:hypothetical protein